MGIAARIDALNTLIQADFGLFPVTATEIEFYLFGSDRHSNLSLFWDGVKVRAKQSGISVFKCEKEAGREQQEIALSPLNNPAQTARDCESIKAIVMEMADKHGMRADFSARPQKNEPGNGLHMHIHLNDPQGKNTFFKNDEKISDTLKFSIGGLLAWLPNCMPIFAPQPESYARFVEKANAPLTVSWGANNRTVAVRLPDAAHDNKHIEHRVAGADANAGDVMAVILAAIHDGLLHRIEPGEQMYGDAALAMYHLPRLPITPVEAQAKLNGFAPFREYFGN